MGSDNHAGVHPRILSAMAAVNTGYAASYGSDDFTNQLLKDLKGLFGRSVEPYFVFSGTAANVLCLKALLKSHEAIICAETAHLHMDECGAPEAAIGCKVLTVPSKDGKITSQDIAKHLVRAGDQHYAQPRVVSITQPTEYGTCYSLDELRELREYTRAHNLRLHIDGARLIYAAHYLNCSLYDLTEGLGVDAVSFGGTKNGLLFGEIVLMYHPDGHGQMKYIRKQGMQLPSKMRFVAAQFRELLLSEGPLYTQIAAQGHAMAKRLAAGLTDIQGVQVTQEVQANSVFAILPKHWTKPLREKYFYYIWDESTWEVRLMISHDVTPDTIDGFLREVKNLSEK